jgi:hypothetical protein
MKFTTTAKMAIFHAPPAMILTMMLDEPLQRQVDGDMGRQEEIQSFQHVKEDSATVSSIRLERKNLFSFSFGFIR